MARINELLQELSTLAAWAYADMADAPAVAEAVRSGDPDATYQAIRTITIAREIDAGSEAAKERASIPPLGTLTAEECRFARSIHEQLIKDLAEEFAATGRRYSPRSPKPERKWRAPSDRIYVRSTAGADLQRENDYLMADAFPGESLF